MKEVLLHIGAHKTGSSSIQEVLKGYADQTTRYASFKEINHSIPITTIFSSDRHNYHIWRKLGLSRAEIDKTRDEFLEALEFDVSDDKFERLIISGEDLSILSAEDKGALISFFENRGIRIKVLMFTRSPQDFAASGIQEHIKGGIKSVPGIGTRYRFRLEEFQKRLPKGDVIVKDFGDTIAEFGDITTGFAKLCGLDIKSTARTNESRSALATKITFRLNKLPINTLGNRQHVLARNKVLNLLAREFSRAEDVRLDKAILAKALTPAENDDISYLSSEFGISYPKASGFDEKPEVEAYLNDLSDLDVGRLRAIANQIQAPIVDGASIDSTLISIYMKTLIETASAA